MFVLRQLLGKECVAYIPSQAPASAPPTSTLTVNAAKFKRLHTKNNEGQKHSKHMVLIYQHFPGTDGGGGGCGRGGAVMRQSLLCRFESTIMQSFESHTGGRNGLSLLQRGKEGEEWRYGETEGAGVGAG